MQQNYQYKIGMTFDGRFLLNKFIGSGSFGEVWQAFDQWTQLDVAIKMYTPMNTKDSYDFMKEFQVAFELNHSNLLHATHLSICKDEGIQRPYLVMPYCPKGSAAKLIGEMTEEQIWEFIADVASGLAYLHHQPSPIIHQDIKPDNILIAKTGEYVITDFGISLQLRKTLTRTSDHMKASAGSIAYMGPEKWSKHYQSVKASDIWSLGVTIFELAVGDLPFHGQGGVMLKSGAEMPDLPEEFSKELNMVMQSCLALETWDRPTAEQLADYARKKTKGESPKPTWNVPVEETRTPAKPVHSKTSSPKKENKANEANKKKQIKKKDNEWISWVILIVAALAVGTVAAWFITMK